MPPLIMNGIFYKGRIEENFIGHIMAEVYKDKVYAPFLQGKKDLTIMDIGANIGVVTNYFSQFGKVYAFEPSKEHFECLTQMVKQNKLKNVIPVRKAIFTENGEFDFGGPVDNKTMRSLHMSTWKDGKPDEKVQAVTLSSFFKEHKIEKVDFMKLDVEGSEMEIISHKSFREVSDKIQTMVIERHSWNGRHPNQLNETLKARGFNVSTMKADADIVVATR